jgi:hypothetical protein
VAAAEVAIRQLGENDKNFSLHLHHFMLPVGVSLILPMRMFNNSVSLFPHLVHIKNHFQTIYQHKFHSNDIKYDCCVSLKAFVYKKFILKVNKKTIIKILSLTRSVLRVYCAL